MSNVKESCILIMYLFVAYLMILLYIVEWKDDY
jgi:hypothetical protein